jgi:hypothetical protein
MPGTENNISILSDPTKAAKTVPVTAEALAKTSAFPGAWLKEESAYIRRLIKLTPRGPSTVRTNTSLNFARSILLNHNKDADAGFILHLASVDFGQN